jgi:lipopolysaccharide exporter
LAAERSLATRAVRGFLWNGSASFIQLGTLLLLYWLLPDIRDMGVFEFARILIMFLALVGNLGLSQALVQRRDIGDDHFHTVFWTNLVWGLFLTALIFVGAPFFAALSRSEQPEEFTYVLRVLCLLLPLASVSGIFRARLQRDLDFAALALSEVVSVLSFGVIVVPLVLVAPDLGVMIPVTGALFREFGLLVSLCRSARWRPKFRFCFPALRQLLRFALNFTGSQAVAYVNTNIASLFIFPVLGPVSQGYYSLAVTVTLTPLVRLSTTINRVSFPTFSTIQDDTSLLRRGYLHSVQGLVLLMGPPLAGLFVFAPELLAFLDKTPALTVLRLLAVATLLKVVGTMVGSMFMARGRTDWSFYWSIFSLIVLIPSMYFALPYGIEGVTFVIAASSLLFLLLSQALANRLISLSLPSYLAALIRPTLVILVFFAALSALHPLLPGPPLFVLLQAAVLGSIIYILSLRLLAWRLCQEYWRSLRGQSSPPS